MKIKLPIVGEVLTGKDTAKVVEVVKSTSDTSVLGGFLDFSSKRLSDEKTVSEKLINAFEEWVYINVTTLAEAVSLLEFELFKFTLVKGNIELVPVEQHELLDLLDKFNQVTTRADAIYNTESHLDLTGDAFWLLEGGKGGKKPTDIFLLQPDKMSLKLSDFNRTSRIVESYDYKITVDGKERKESYDPTEMLHIKVPNPANPYRGKSVVEGIVTTIDTDNYSIVALNNLFRNGMIGDFMLTTDKRMTPEQLKRFRSQFKAAYTGVRNAWKIPILFGGVKPERLQMSGREMQLIEIETALRNKIMSAFKNTRSSLGIDDEVNRSTSESSLLNWKRSVIAPKMARIVNALNEYLVPRYGNNLILGFKDPVPEDRSSKITEATELYDKGVITRNEARQITGYEERPGEDTFKSSPTAPTFDDNLKRTVPSLKYINYRRVFSKANIYQEAREYQDAYKQALPYAKKLIKNKKKVDEPIEEAREHAKFTNEQVWKYWEKQIGIVEVAEAIFENQIKQFIDDTVVEGLSNLDDPEARKGKKLIDKERRKEDAVNKFTPILTEVLIGSGQLANNLIGIDEPYIPTKAINTREELRKQVLLFAASMLDTDIDEMVNQLAIGLEEGLSIAQIRRNIQDKFDELSKVQAERITRTEVIRTSNLGAQDAFEQSGVVVGKQWLTAMDDRVDPLCRAMNGRIISLRSDFFKKGDVFEADGKSTKLDYSNVAYPPLHVACRCTLLPVIEGQDDFDVRSFEEFQDLHIKIHELQDKADKRTKKYKEWKAKYAEAEKSKTDLADYVKELEKIAGIDEA